MTVEELIDDALQLGDNVAPTSADYALRRRLALRYLRQVVSEIWWLRDHPWKKKQATVTVADGTDMALLPVDFNSLGVYGGVYRQDDGEKLDEVPESVIMDLNQAPGFTGDIERYFSLHGQDATTFLGYLRVPRQTTARTLTLLYQPNPPFLLDAGDTAVVSTLSAALARVGTTVTVTTVGDHGYENAQWVVVSGATQTEYNGTWQITVIGATTFTFQITTTPATPATGSPVCVLSVARHNRAILAIPSKYHETVIAWGLRERMRESKGDARWEYARLQYEAGKRDLLKEESRFQGSYPQLRSFFGRGVY